MKTFAAWVGVLALFAGILVLATWAVKDCEHRGGHEVTVVPGKVYRCSK